MNHYGLRRSLSAGPITVGNIYELSPFDNEIVLIDLKGSDLYDLARQIIKNNGEPISNFKIEYKDIDHLKIYISDKPVNPDSIYVAATLDYTYTSDNNLNALRQGKNYRRVGILLRDSIINYLKQMGDKNKRLNFTKKSLIQKIGTE
jgi:2',3'-cyclic-nucleotide 2'-phosphodiesterase (5'-nucleotidase family)